MFSEEIYTDRESRIARYRRLLAIVAVCMVFPLTAMEPAMRNLDGLPGPFYAALLAIRFLLLGVGILAMVRLLSLIGRLRR